MLFFLPFWLKGFLSLLLYFANTIVLCLPFYFIAPFKLLKIDPLTNFINKILTFIAVLWADINALNSKLFCKINWDIRGPKNLNKNDWYLLICNHNSSVDILALQMVFNRRIPMFKFFLKKELFWFPFLGFTWWALDYPFMKRYSKKAIKKNPALKGQDIQRAKQACEKFKTAPATIMNFVEGTRFSREKKQKQNNEFSYLLNPKSGGVAFVMDTMKDYIDKIIDVTIVYPEKTPSFWDYISGRVDKIIIDYQLISTKNSFTKNDLNESEYKEKWHDWLNSLWHEKDEKIKNINEKIENL